MAEEEHNRPPTIPGLLARKRSSSLAHVAFLHGKPRCRAGSWHYESGRAIQKGLAKEFVLLPDAMFLVT